MYVVSFFFFMLTKAFSHFLGFYISPSFIPSISKDKMKEKRKHRTKGVVSIAIKNNNNEKADLTLVCFLLTKAAHSRQMKGKKMNCMSSYL